MCIRDSDIVIHYNSNYSGAEDTCRQIMAAGGKAHSIQADLSKVGEVKRLFDEGIEFLGGLDLYVNNSGITLTSAFEETTEELFDKIVAVDFKSAYFCIQSAAAKMSERGTSGSIVVISSSNAFQQVPQASVYGSVKTALCKLTRHAAAEYAKYGIRVNCIAPGLIEVPRYFDMPGYARESRAGMVPWGGVGLPDDIGKPVVFFLSSDADFITCHTLYVDGGTNFVSVVTFNSLAANVVASMAKGQPVIVYGRLRVNMWSTAEGHSNTSVEIDAYHVGHDLMWGQSLFTKSPRAQFDTTDRLSEPEIQQALAEDVDGPSDIEDEDREPDWSPINIDFTADAADPVVIEGAPLTGASSWSGANPETDAYVVAHAR